MPFYNLHMVCIQILILRRSFTIISISADKFYSKLAQLLVIFLITGKSTFSDGRMDGESNESVYNNIGMSIKIEGMECGLIEVRCRTLRWFNREIMPVSEMTQRGCMSMINVECAKR